MISWTMELVDLAFLILGKTGKILGARALRVCFLVDIVCLLYWLYVDIERGLVSQACSVCFGIAINIYGYFNWKKKGIG